MLSWERRRSVFSASARFVSGLAGCLAVLVFSTAAPAAAAPSNPAPKPRAANQPQATFGIGPASAKKIDGRPLLNYLSSPGGRLTDHVAVINIADKPVTLNLYAADATNGADGSIGYKARAEPRTDANWISLDTPGRRPSLSIGARATVIVPLSVTVPLKATPGDHAVGIIASLTSKINGKSGQQVDFEQRVALRTYIRVSGDLKAQLEIDNLTAAYHGTVNPFGRGKVSVAYTLRNSGNVKLGGRQSLSVNGLFGKSGSVTALADVPLLLPGSSVQVSARVLGVQPSFSMRAKVTVRPLQLQGDVNPATADATASTSFWAIPWSDLALLAVLLVLLAAALWWRRRGSGRGSRGSGRHGLPQPVTQTPEKVDA